MIEKHQTGPKDPVYRPTKNLEFQYGPGRSGEDVIPPFQHVMTGHTSPPFMKLKIDQGTVIHTLREGDSVWVRREIAGFLGVEVQVYQEEIPPAEVDTIEYLKARLLISNQALKAIVEAQRMIRIDLGNLLGQVSSVEGATGVTTYLKETIRRNEKALEE